MLRCLGRCLASTKRMNLVSYRRRIWSLYHCEIGVGCMTDEGLNGKRPAQLVGNKDNILLVRGKETAAVEEQQRNDPFESRA